jgi:glycosyltransferase involved in cell wall biosynthesis
MKVVLVHDSIGEFGGAERVLLALSEIFPDAPIYTSFKRDGELLRRLKGKRIITSWVQYIPFFSTKLHSPLRFLAPLIWGSFDFSKYDVVISSASWYVNKGYGDRVKGQGEREVEKKRKRPVEFCYCHTPPRRLWGLGTPFNADKNFIVRLYVLIVSHFLRMYDFSAAQRVNYFIANSKNVAGRIEKFYRRESEVIYPPATLSLARRAGPHVKKGDYYLIVSRITKGKGIEMAVAVANRLKIPLKIAGAPSGYSETYEWIKKNAGPTVEMMGYVTDAQRTELYSEARAFLALQKDEDFGMTLVEAQSVGTPVIAYNGGGYPESVIPGKTGILFDDYSVSGLERAIVAFGKVKFKEEDCIKQARKFSKERFKTQILKFVEEKMAQGL